MYELFFKMKLVTYLALIVFIWISLCDCLDDISYSDKEKVMYDDESSLSELGIQNLQLTQKVDHTVNADLRTWSQRYQRDLSSFSKNGSSPPQVVLLYIPGSPSDNLETIKGSYVYEIAQKNNAAIFCPFLRFFHEIQTYWDMSTKNLVYLSIQQTLQDLIYFITEMNVKHGFSEDTKWIAIGGAKGGSLAAWLRYLYSNVVHGAVASSAPMHFQPEIAGYYDTIGRILNDYNPRCKVAIEQAHAKLDEMSQSKNGRREISKLMNVCSQLSSLDMDYQFFMTIGMNYLCEVLEKDHSRKGVEQICTIMMNKSEESSPVERYSNVIRMIMNHKDEKCIATKFSDFAATLKTLDILPHTMKIKRADLYERCTQYGLFPTSTSSKSFHLSRSLKLDLYLVLCSIVVPFKVNENYLSEMTKKTNTAYAGLRIVANNLLFVGGTEDPSSQVQITSKDGKNEKKCEIIVVKGGHRCSDLQPSRKEDSKDLIESRNNIIKIVNSWL